MTALPRNRRVMIVLFGAALIAALAVAALSFRDYRKEHAARAAIAEMIGAMSLPPEAAGFHARADAVRDFIWRNSAHLIDAEFRAHWGNTPVIVAKMLAYQAGRTAHAPPLECSSRTALMERALQALGYRTRSVDVYKYGPAFFSHSFLEALNPETNAWEVYDPDYDIFWTDKAGTKRIGIQDIIAAPDLDQVRPCLSENMCGWDIAALDGRGVGAKRPYFGLAVVIDRRSRERPLFVNQARFPLPQPVTRPDGKQMTYCQYRPKDCKGKIVLY
jgi:hypothetical protein